MKRRHACACMRKVTPHHLQTKRRKDSVFFLPCCVIKAHENTNRRKGYSSHIFSFFFPRVNVKSFSTGRTGRGQFGYMITIVVPFATLRQIFPNRGELFLHRFLPDFPRTFFFLNRFRRTGRDLRHSERVCVCERRDGNRGGVLSLGMNCRVS